MWEDIIIGKGDKGCTAVVCFKIKGKHSISENSVSYWINNLIFDFGMTIFKDTKEGKKLTDMINKETHLQKILDYLNTIVLNKMKLSDLMRGIEKIENESYQKGKLDMKNEFRSLLGLKPDYC
jgi:hypothetical protein